MVVCALLITSYVCLCPPPSPLLHYNVVHVGAWRDRHQLHPEGPPPDQGHRVPGEHLLRDHQDVPALGEMTSDAKFIN